MAEQLDLFARPITWHALRWITNDENHGTLFVRSTDRRVVNATDPFVVSGEAEYICFEEARRG